MIEKYVDVLFGGSYYYSRKRNVVNKLLLKAIVIKFHNQDYDKSECFKTFKS